MKLKYPANSARKRLVGAIMGGVFLLLPFAATLFLVLSDVPAALRERTWMIPCVLALGLAACVYAYCTPPAFLKLDPHTRIATFVDGDTTSDFTFAALGPLLLVSRPIPAKPHRLHYSIETAAVPVVFHVDSLREKTEAKARKLSQFLGVECRVVEAVQPMDPIG